MKAKTIKSKIDQKSDSLYLITLPQEIEGFQSFISSWVYKGEFTAVVDPGPLATSGALKSALDHMNATPDFFLLTHIHIDHSGGMGALTNHFPEALVVCPEKGIPHLIDPEKLWKGSLKTLGKTAEAYGPIHPVPENRLSPPEAFVKKVNNEAVFSVSTPGHAPHHESYFVDGILFAGEAGGVCLPHDTPEDEPLYLRPATPPRFFYEMFLESVDRLIAHDADMMCYGHYGYVDDPKERLYAHRDQLGLWRDSICEDMDDVDSPDFVDRMIDKMLDKDPLLYSFRFFPMDVQKRERYFLSNSVKGYAGYLKPKE